MDGKRSRVRPSKTGLDNIKRGHGCLFTAFSTKPRTQWRKVVSEASVCAPQLPTLSLEWMANISRPTYDFISFHCIALCTIANRLFLERNCCKISEIILHLAILQEVPLGSLLDNADVELSTGDLWVGAHPIMCDLVNYMTPPYTSKSPSQVRESKYFYFYKILVRGSRYFSRLCSQLDFSDIIHVMITKFIFDLP